MSILSDTLSRKITVLTKEQLQEASKIYNYTFENCNLLTSVDMPDSIESIGGFAFSDCTSLSKVNIGKNVKAIQSMAFWRCSKLSKIILTEQIQLIGVSAFEDCIALANISTENLNPYCQLSANSFRNTKWLNNMPVESMVLIANGKILLDNKVTKPSAGFIIPNTVINLASYSCERYGTSVDNNFISAIIPDTVEIIQDSVFYNQSSLKQITVGSSVRKIGYGLCEESMSTLIFRQPADMYIELPKPGRDTGIYGGKSSISVDIYTDNEMLKAYDWATDNVTATIHPLSEAPA